jgi:hypothetical protein
VRCFTTPSSHHDSTSSSQRPKNDTSPHGFSSTGTQRLPTLPSASTRSAQISPVAHASTTTTPSAQNVASVCSFAHAPSTVTSSPHGCGVPGSTGAPTSSSSHGSWVSMRW